VPVDTLSPDRFALSAADRGRLERRLSRAVRRARSRGEALAAITVRLDGDVDPAAVVFASRAATEPSFVFEQPDRDGSALAALGCVRELRATGPDRFTAVAAAWRALIADAALDAPDGPPGSGPVAVGGFAFADQGSTAPHWAAFPSASLHVPEVALQRRYGEVRMTLAAIARPDDTAEDLLAGLEARVGTLRQAPLPLLDPEPVGHVQVASTMPPEHYEQAVARAVERIHAGEFSKIVLAREVAVHAPAPHDVAAIHGILREAFPGCFVFAVSRGERAFIAASPELLMRRDGLRVSTLGLAGSTRRSADPAVDDHLGEQLLRSDKDREEHAIVVRRIERSLRSHALWVTAAPDPVVVQMANIQHLATPIRAQLGHPVSALELAGALHPTPAVGGEPLAVAGPLIPALEGLDRGWYAGPVGWADASEDGEFCVALRSALVDGPLARCFAGVGVVADSDPAAELAETETKLQALLPVLAL
jgi:salicylate biosynthesis isochorismate synthase/menaquinone-specific isochorismate synthase